jgi:hypothetical protein
MRQKSDRIVAKSAVGLTMKFFDYEWNWTH